LQLLSFLFFFPPSNHPSPPFFFSCVTRQRLGDAIAAAFFFFFFFFLSLFSFSTPPEQGEYQKLNLFLYSPFLPPLLFFPDFPPLCQSCFSGQLVEGEGKLAHLGSFFFFSPVQLVNTSFFVSPYLVFLFPASPFPSLFFFSPAFGISPGGR